MQVILFTASELFASFYHFFLGTTQRKRGRKRCFRSLRGRRGSLLEFVDVAADIRLSSNACAQTRLANCASLVLFFISFHHETTWKSIMIKRLHRGDFSIEGIVIGASQRKKSQD